MNSKARMTKTPVYNEPIGVRTPLALLTAPRDLSFERKRRALVIFLVYLFVVNTHNEPVPGKP